MSQVEGATIYFCHSTPICSSDACVIDCRCGTPAECAHESKKVGIIVVCIFGVLLLVIVISSIAALLRCKKRKQKQTTAAGQQSGNKEQENPVSDSRQAQPMDIVAHDKQNSTNIEGPSLDSSRHEEVKSFDKLEIKYLQL
jgi:hypothetical protein